MSRIVNLKQVRKTRARMEARARADENAVRFGRTREEAARDAAERKAADAHLDAHRRDE